jgi:MraZ protein
MRRVLLPAPLKKAIDALQSGCFEAFCFQPCLELYPMEEWDIMMMKINKLNRFVKRTMILSADLQLV